MKNFLSLLLFLTLFSFSLHADDDALNDTCPGETITELHGTVLQVTHSLSGQVKKNGGDDVDYYTFEPAGSGKLVFSYVSDDNSSLAVTAVSDCASNTNTLITNGTTLTDTTIIVQPGKAVNIRINIVDNLTANYTLTMLWTPDALSSVAIDSPNDCSTTGASTGVRDFCRRTNIIANGGMVTIGNTVLVPPDPLSQDCSAYSNGDFDPDYDNSNAGLNMCKYEGLSTTGRSATSALLTLPDPANSTIAFAGLYWQSIVDEDDIADVTGMDVHIQNQNATGIAAGLKSVTVHKLDYELDVGKDGFYSYAAFSDVTSIFTTNNWKDGNITVEGVPSFEGSITNLGNYGAWTLVVVYKDPSLPLKNFSIFDGWQIISGHSPDISADLEIGIKGFYTPKTGPINANVSIFVAEGDKYIPDDQLTIVNELDGSQVLLGDQDSGIDGVPVRTPFLINNNGIDIHTYAVGNYLQHEQSFVRFHFKNVDTTPDAWGSYNQDTHWPSMIAFETDIYEPSLCYDYAYSQNDVFFTNENNGTEEPRIEGDPIQSGDPIDVSLYIRNLEDSDVNARNVYLDITDINTTQAVYSNNSLRLTYPNNILSTEIPDSDFIANPGSLVDIDIGTVTGNDYFYAEYKLLPSMTTIDMPINATIRYDLVFSDGTTIPFTSLLGGEKLPMCSGGSTNYNPSWSIFDIVDHNLYSDANKKYNIPTQVARRPGSFSLVSFEPSDLVTHKPVNTQVSVELIDAGAYHVTSASCSKTSSAISGKIWVTFNNDVTDGDPSDEEVLDIAYAINGGYVTQHPDYPFTTAEDFFSVARENAAFRISFNVLNDNGEDFIQLSGTDNSWQIENFVSLVQDIGECSAPVRFNQSTSTTTTNVATACGNAGGGSGSIMNNWQLTRCQECLYGYRTEFVCSRDNFSIRPEALDFRIFDRPGGVTPELELAKESVGAVGYSYHYDITATSHDTDTQTIGYTQYFNGGTDANLSFEWFPDASRNVSNCLNTGTQSPFLYIKDGLDVNAEGNSTSLGRYKVNIIDRAWTAADVNPAHHSGINPLTGIDHSIYFEPDDCISNSSVVPLISNNYNADKVGCDIRSSHTNQKTGTVFQDFNLTFRPYEYRVYTTSPDVNSILITKGSSDQNITANDYVYMNNISTELGANILPEDIEVSTRYRAFVRPVGADNNNSLQNFVDNCYAEPLKFDADISLPASPQNFRARSLISNTNDLSNFNTANTTSDTTEVLTSGAPSTLNISAAAFTLTNPGTVALEFDYNYDRERNTSVNPIKVNFKDSNLTCTNPADCKRIADLIDEAPVTNLAFDANITYIYGRLHTPRHRVADPDPGTLSTLANIPLNYEFYCEAPGCTIEDYNAASTLPISPIGLLSPDDVRWYIQAIHNVSTDGNATQTRTRNGLDDARFTGGMSIDADSMGATYVYDGVKGYPYKATIELSTRDWLLYNRYDATATVNDFELEFTTAGNWSGKDESGMGLDGNSSTNVNRRVEW